MKPWLCSCHKTPMYWNVDKRLKRGGFWECREKRREYNAKRISLFGTRMAMPDMDFRALAVKLREDRKHG